MSALVCLGTVVLAAMVNASLQMNFGGLLLLYHSSLGKNSGFGRKVPKKTRVLVSNFILGVALMIFLGVATAGFLILTFFKGELGVIELSFVVGGLFALAIVVCFFYYRSGQTTELWVPRTIARFINMRAKKTTARVEAFSLGMLTCLAELPFVAILLVVAADAILQLSPVVQMAGIAIYIGITVLPLILCRFFVRKGSTVAEIQKWRVKNKTFLRVFSGVGFAILALFLTAFKVMGNL